MPRPRRRALLTAATLLTACTSREEPRANATTAPEKLRVAALFAGPLDDGGFVEAGYRGLVAARDALGATLEVKDSVPPEQGKLADVLRELARAKPDLVIAHGGQNDQAAQLVAAEFPATKFVVTQGTVTGPNLASYEVLQEQSAFLAGALAAWTTQTDVVGHMSGIRVKPGLKGRAAYANGVAHAKPSVKLLTNFSGNQDDNELSKTIALELAEQGADVIFTMLNAGRSGAIDACRERGIKQIGNVGDWVARDPEVFLGSAFADVGLAVYNAVADAAAGRLAAGSVKHIGLENEAAVRLVVNADVPDEIRAKLDALAADIREERVTVSTDWKGEELANPWP